MKHETLTSQKRSPAIVTVASVPIEPIHWLWWPYVPLRKITIVEGDPGVGKTYFALALTAILSRGWGLPDQEGKPGETSEPRNVLYMSAEDGIGDTLRPRLEAAGGDANRVHALLGWTEVTDGETHEGHVLLGHTDLLREAVERVQPAAVIIDPLQAYLGEHVDAHRANEVRPILAGVARLAERHDFAAIAIRHLGKQTKTRAVYSGLGSIDFAAAARSILLLGDHQGERLMAHVKSSLAPQGTSLRYAIRDGTFQWAGVSYVNADDMLAVIRTSGESNREDEAKDFLTDMLELGPQPAKQILSTARQAGIPERTLRRAKDILGITSKRIGKLGTAGEWIWELNLPNTNGSLSSLRNETSPGQENQDGHDGNLSGSLRSPKAANKALRLPLRMPGAILRKKDRDNESP